MAADTFSLATFASSDADRIRAERAGAMVELRVATQQWDAAHAAVEWARADAIRESECGKEINPYRVMLVDTGLGVREMNALERIGVVTVGQLGEMTVEQVEALPNVATRTVERFQELCRAYGMKGRKHGPSRKPSANGHAKNGRTANNGAVRRRRKPSL
jgi:DNA-directed RNA polymerase alpha subunit